MRYPKSTSPVIPHWYDMVSSANNKSELGLGLGLGFPRKSVVMSLKKKLAEAVSSGMTSSDWLN